MARRFDPADRKINRPLSPGNTLFHDTPVATKDGRDSWFEEGKDMVRQADVVFCDPDMG